MTAEFRSIEDTLEKAKDIKDSSRYNIRLRNANDGNDVATTAYKPVVKTPKLMFYQTYETTGHTQRNLHWYLAHEWLWK